MGCEQYKNTDYSPAAVACREKEEYTTDELIKIHQDRRDELATFVGSDGEAVVDINAKLEDLVNQFEKDEAGNVKNTPANRLLQNQLNFLQTQYNKSGDVLQNIYGELQNPPTVEEWNAQTSELIRLNGGTDEDIDFTGQGTESWEMSQLLRNKSRKSDIDSATLMNILNRPGGPTQSQFEYVHSKNKYLKSKQSGLILEDPGGEPSDFVVGLYKNQVDSVGGNFELAFPSVSQFELEKDGKTATKEEEEEYKRLQEDKPSVWSGIKNLFLSGGKSDGGVFAMRGAMQEEIDKYSMDLGNRYESKINFLQQERKKLSPFADHQKIREIDEEIKRLQYSSQNAEREEFTKTSRQFQKVKDKIKNISKAERRQINNQFENGEITEAQRDERLALLDEEALALLPKAVQAEYKDNLKIIDRLTTAHYTDTWSSFGSFVEKGENVDRNGDGVIDEKDEYIDQSEVYLPSDEVQGAILDIVSTDPRLKNALTYELFEGEKAKVSLEQREQIISAAKHIVLEDNYSEQTSEFEKANEILYKYADLKNVPPEVITAANKIRGNAVKNIQAINTELGWNVATGAFDDQFRMSGQFKHWRDKHIDNGQGGNLADAIGTFTQGLIQIGGEAIVGTGVTLGDWMNKGVYGFLDYLDIDPSKTGFISTREEAEQKQDYIDAVWSKWGGLNFLGISDKGGSVTTDGFNLRTASKTFSNMLPFTVGVAVAARKGDFSKVTKAYTMMRGMGVSTQTKAALSMGSFAYKATINDNRMEAKELGLDDGASIFYANAMSLATATSQAIMPDIKFFNTTAGKNMVQNFVGNLKQVASKEGRKAAVRQFFNNLAGELGEEELELLMQDMVKASVGLSNEMQFFDLDTQIETVYGTVLLSGGTSIATAPSLMRNTRNQVYNQFRLDAAGTVEAMENAEAEAQKQLDAARKQGNQKAIDRAQLQLDQVQKAKKDAANIIKAINVAPDIMNNEAIELLAQKEALLEEKSKLRKNSPDVKTIDDAIAAIDAQIESGVIAQNQQDIKERSEANVQKLAEDMGVTFNPVTKEQGKDETLRIIREENARIKEENRTRDKNNQLPLIDEGQADEQGFIIQNPDGTQRIVVNGYVEGIEITTAQHELFHGVLKSTLQANPEQLAGMAKGLREFLDANLDAAGILGEGYLKNKLEQYKNDPQSVKDEELLTIVSEGMTQGYIAFEEGGIIDKLGDTFRRFLSSLGFKASFKSGKDVYNFIKDFNRSVEKGEFSKGMKKTIAEGANVDMQQDNEIVLADESAFKPDQTRADKVQLMYNSGGTNKSQNALKIAQTYKPLVQALVNAFDLNVVGSMDKKNAIDNIIADGTNPGSIYSIIMNYNPDSGISLDETIGRALMPQQESTTKSSKKVDSSGVIKAAPVDVVGDVTESVIKESVKKKGKKEEEEGIPAEYDVERIKTNLELNRDVGQTFLREDNRKKLEEQLARAEKVEGFIDKSPAELREMLANETDPENKTDLEYALKRQQEVRFPGNVGITDPITGDAIKETATTPGTVKSSKVTPKQIVYNLSEKGLNVSEKQVDDMVGKITSRATAKFWSRMSATNQEIVPRKLYKDSARNLLLEIANNYRKEISKNTGKQVTFEAYMANTGMQRLNSLAKDLGAKQKDDKSLSDEATLRKAEQQQTAEETTVAKPETVATQKAVNFVKNVNPDIDIEAFEKKFNDALIANAAKEGINISDPNLTPKQRAKITPYDVLAEALGISDATKISNPKQNLNQDAAKVQRALFKSSQLLKNTILKKAYTDIETVQSKVKGGKPVKIGGVTLGFGNNLLNKFFNEPKRLGSGKYVRTPKQWSQKRFEESIGVKDGKIDPNYEPRKQEEQIMKAMLKAMAEQMALRGTDVQLGKVEQTPAVKKARASLDTMKTDVLSSKKWKGEMAISYGLGEFNPKTGKGFYNIDNATEADQYVKDVAEAIELAAQEGIILQYSDFAPNFVSNKALRDRIRAGLQEVFVNNPNVPNPSRLLEKFKKKGIKGQTLSSFLGTEQYNSSKPISKNNIPPGKWNNKNKNPRDFTNKEIRIINKYHEKVFNDNWKAINKIIQKYPRLGTVFMHHFTVATNEGNHWHRKGAPMAYVDRDFQGDYYYEHAWQQVNAWRKLIEISIAEATGNLDGRPGFDATLKAVQKNYQLIAISALDNKKLDDSRYEDENGKMQSFKNGMGKGWNVFDGKWWQRYFNENIIDGGITTNIESVYSGKSIGEELNIDSQGRTLNTKVGKDVAKAQTRAQQTLNDGTKSSKKANITNSINAKAKAAAEQTLDKDFNNIIEDVKGITSVKRYSDIGARRAGRGKGRFRFFIPPGAEDFKGLIYNFLGKGKKGEKHFQFFDKNLLKPYWQAVSQIERFRRAIKSDYSALLKASPEVRKKLGKLIPTKGKTNFTYDHAIRAYLMVKSGYDLTEAGLSKRDAKLLFDTVKKDAELTAFADGLQLISKQQKWLKPTGGFDVQTIQSDIHRFTSGEGRKKFLENSGFMQNVDEIFSKENLNKIEAAYGKNLREALEDTIYRMKNGTNRQSGTNRLTNTFNNWINRSVGAIMFFNRKSALLQTISSVNFINWSDNNPLKAAMAFANQKQYWKDFAFIFNSPKLKERRAGLKGDINEAELADAVRGATNKAEAALAWLLKQGFLPTQMADSFAIASGGATFYRNRINTYIAQGMNQQAAEKKAFEDFSRISEESQQSADPAMISEQQASPLGRFTLNFQNTPMQYTRLMKRAGQDLINRRRIPGMTQAQSDATYISKIIYYGAVQNFIFAALQNALFAVIPGFGGEDDEEELMTKEQQQRKKEIRIANNMVDTLLRGTGIYGAIAATLKNTIVKFYENEGKDPFAKDNADILLEAANLSPVVGSKLRKLNNALKTREFEKDVISERGWEITRDGRLNLSPSYRVLGSGAEALLNVPLERTIAEIDALVEMTDQRNSSLERIALALGWRTWDVGVKNEEHDQIRVEVKEKRKREKEEERKRKREEEKRLAEEKRFEGLTNKEINALKRRDQIEALTKQQQIDSLLKLGVSKKEIRSLRLESQRIDKIIEINTK